MSKITFRADDDLVEQLEALDLSKSEAMREALRSYLEDSDDEQGVDCADREPMGTEAKTGMEAAIDDLVRERVDELLAERLRTEPQPRTRASDTQDVNVTIALEGVEGRPVADSERDAQVSDDAEPVTAVTREPDREQSRRQCGQCGERVDGDHVYCPNCGEKVSRRLFCDCGDELRSDWSFCPGCGRRTPAADVLESG